MMNPKVEPLLAVIKSATAPLDARVREDPKLFVHPSKIATSSVDSLGWSKSKSEDLEAVCHPWDHAEFLARVSSFSIASWFAKPQVISTLECSRHGWTNSAPDQLHCKCCQQYLCFKIDCSLSEAGTIQVAKMFADQLIIGHTELCPWRDNPSPKSFTTLPIATKRQVFENFIDRLKDVVVDMIKEAKFQMRIAEIQIADHVKTKILKESNSFTEMNELASQLLAAISQPENSTLCSKAVVNAAFLIVSGWQFDEITNTTFWCAFCNRQWNAPPEIISNQMEPPAKRLKSSGTSFLDPLSQHRHFCPWIVALQCDGIDEYAEADTNVWEFVNLCGWKRFSKSLEFLHINQVEMDRKRIRSDPVEALESIQAVLGL